MKDIFKIVIPLLIFTLISNNASAYSVSIQFPYVPKIVSNFPQQLFMLCQALDIVKREKRPENDLSFSKLGFSHDDLTKTCKDVRHIQFTFPLDAPTIRRLKLIKKNVHNLGDMFAKEIDKVILEAETKSTNKRIQRVEQANISNVKRDYEQPKAPIAISREPQSLGSLEEKFVAGLADFVVERATEESMLFFQEELNNNLCENKVQYTSKKLSDTENINIDNNRNLVKEYFENLCEVFKSQIYGFSLTSVGSYLRTAAKIDLENIPDVAFRHAYLSYKFYEKNPDDEFYAQKKQFIHNNVSVNGFRVALAAYRETRRGLPALDFIRAVTMLNFCGDDEECENMVALMRTAAVIIHAVEANTSLQSDNITHGFQLAGALLTLDEQLLFRKNSKPRLSIVCSASKDQCLEDRELEALGSEISHFFPHVVEIIQQTRSAKGESTDFQNKIIDPKQSIIARTVALEETLTLIADITRRFNRYQHDNILKFNATPEQLSELAGKAMKVREIFRFGSAYLTHDRVEMAMAGLEILNSTSVSPHFDKKSMNVVKASIPFITELASAQSTQEVATVIQAAAAPVGSYKMKFRRKMTSFTAFAGLAIGMERYTNRQSDDASKSLVRSIFVPFGLHMSIPFPENNWLARSMGITDGNKWFRSGGVFLSAIDLGTVVAWRSSDYDSQEKVKLMQLLSPGIYGTFHLNGPSIIGFGVSATPKLLEDESDRDISVMRAHFFIAVDLTLFPF